MRGQTTYLYKYFSSKECYDVTELKILTENYFYKVSKLEQELQKQRESSAEKLRKMQEKCEAATHEADLKRQKVIELTGTAR